MQFNREITLTIKLNNTGLKWLNGQTINSDIAFMQEQLVYTVKGNKFGSFKEESLTYLEWLVATFKEEVSDSINNLLLDELKGHTHSIPRHNKFDDWLKGAEVRLSPIRHL